MGTTLAELLLLLAAVAVVYRLLGPLRRRLEDRLLRTLDPKRRRVIDVKPEDLRSAASGVKPSKSKE